MRIQLYWKVMCTDKTNDKNKTRGSGPLPFLQTDQIVPSIQIGKKQQNLKIY